MSRWRDRLIRGGAIYVASAVLCVSLWALQKVLASKVHNYPNTPVEVKRSKVTLVETYATPGQLVTPGTKARTTRVRYANRAGLTPSVFMLNGEVVCTNTSPQAVEALSVAIVVLDAFHEALAVGGQRYVTKQVMEPLPRGGSKTITWEQQLSSQDAYEVAVVVTRVRFADGSVWAAPQEELLDIF